MNLTDDSEKPVGEWNTMMIEARGDEIIVHVNGDLVNHGKNATATKGKIALQAEGSEDDLVIPRGQIASHDISKRSLMPEGLIDGFTDQQVADLFAYLMTLK